ncbi:MAG: methyltransferase [Clostridia bacterium]|nr:methyltransferase [Clostridia bacterium]
MVKQLDIRPGVVLLQDDRFFALGEDTMLLSHFAQPKKGGLGLDLGAGQGFLGILTGLRRPDVRLEAMELQPDAAQITAENALRAGLEITVTCGDLRELPNNLHHRYDFVLCNPPYFEQSRGKTAAGALAQARSDAGASIGEVCTAAAKVLKTGGRLYLCFPANRLAGLFSALEGAKLAPKRLRFVHPRPGKEANLVLLDAVKEGGEGVTVLPPLFLKDTDGLPSEEYREIYEVRT